MTGRIRPGIRLDLDIDGAPIPVGFAEVLGQWQAAYVPLSAYRFKIGDVIKIPDHTFRVTSSGMSPVLPKMCLLMLDKE